MEAFLSGWSIEWALVGGVLFLFDMIGWLVSHQWGRKGGRIAWCVSVCLYERMKTNHRSVIFSRHVVAIIPRFLFFLALLPRASLH